MPNVEHLDILNRGVEEWNAWRERQLDLRSVLMPEDVPRPTLSGADLSGKNLRGINLRRTRLYRTNLRGTDLFEADLYDADLSWADMREADLTLADLTAANLEHADLCNARLGAARLGQARLWRASLRSAELVAADLNGADLRNADLSGADLTGADLTLAQMVETNLTKARLNDCHIYGISAWSLILDAATEQNNLIIARPGEPHISVDNLEIAQFGYLLLNNEKVRQVIDTITSKAVLILGRFTPERKAVLDAIRNALRRHDYLPIMFDFERPEARNYIETVS